MKIVCIDDVDMEKWITLNKIYKGYIVYYTSNGQPTHYITNRYNYVIEDDLGSVNNFNGKRFITLEEYREIKLGEILDEGSRKI